MPQPDRQGLHHPGAVGLQVLAGDGALDPLQIGGDLAPHIAAVEIGQARMGELVEGLGELEAPAQRAGRRQLALDEESLGKAGSGKQGGLLQKRIAPLRRSDRHSLRGRDGWHRRAGDRAGICPPSARASSSARPQPLDGPGDRERRIGPARRDGVVALVPVAPDGGERAGRPRGIEGVDAAARLAHQPEAVAAEAVHVRIDHGDRRRHGDHGLDRVAAGGQDRLAGLGGEPMGSRDGGGREDGGFGHGP